MSKPAAWVPLGFMNEDGIQPADELDRGALSLAHLAAVETHGSQAAKTEAAIWAYLWAQRNISEKFGMEVYPSLNQLREALAERRAIKSV